MWSAPGVRHKGWFLIVRAVTQVQLHIKTLLLNDDDPFQVVGPHPRFSDIGLQQI
jgi:hypothetical protein